MILKSSVYFPNMRKGLASWWENGFASSFASGRMAFYSLMEVLGIGEGMRLS